MYHNGPYQELEGWKFPSYTALALLIIHTHWSSSAEKYFTPDDESLADKGSMNHRILVLLLVFTFRPMHLHVHAYSDSLYIIVCLRSLALLYYLLVSTVMHHVNQQQIIEGDRGGIENI